MAKRFTNSDHWCTGEDSNLRSSGERQIYSLLPLTTRPPVQKRRTQVQPSFLSGRAARSRPQGSTLLWPGQRRKSELRASILPHEIHCTSEEFLMECVPGDPAAVLPRLRNCPVFRKTISGAGEGI